MIIVIDYKIYAVDFDGTLCDSNYPEFGDPIQRVIDFCKEKQREGHKLILWTCRTGKPLDDAVMWCTEHGLYFDAVNDNLPELNKLYGNNSRKVYADFYIDDKNIDMQLI